MAQHYQSTSTDEVSYRNPERETVGSHDRLVPSDFEGEYDEALMMHPILAALPRPLRFDKAPIEATGLAVDIFARATIIMSSLFLGSALLELASADCDPGDAECRVYGFRPSSLLTNIAVISGVLVSLFLPLFGAIVDHTNYRRQVGAYTAVGLVVVKAIETCVGPRTWFFVACLQVVSSILYNPHITATYAYTSELSSDAMEQARYNTQLIVVMYISTLFFLIEVLGVARLFHTDDVGTARISQINTSVTCAVLFAFAWTHLFRDRPALSKVPAGRSVVGSGIRKVKDTAVQIATHYRGLRWFMLSLIFADSALGALVVVSTTFLKQVLQMQATEIGSVFLVVILCGIPGSKFGGWLAVWLRDPIASAKLADVYLILVTAAASQVLTGPDRKNLALVFGGLWGIGLGWLPPMHTTGFIALIPKNQEAELMGMFLLCNQVLAWLPPLLFTVLNEAGYDMAYGLASLDIFFLMGLICRVCVGDYQRAVDEVTVAPLVDEVELEERSML